MKSFTLFGVRVMTERAWLAEITEREALRFDRDAVIAELVKVVIEGQALGTAVEGLVDQHHVTEAEIRTAIETVLSCNIRLARRVEVAEHEAAQARAKQAEGERVRRRLDEVVDHVERFCDNPDTVAWVQQRSGLRRP